MKQETLEEYNKKSFGEIWSTLTTEQSEYLRDYINRQREDAKKWQQERSYSEEEVLKLVDNLFHKYSSDFRVSAKIDTKEWFEKFKKK